MLRFLDRPARLCDGLSRREALRAGGLGALGLALPELWTSRSVAAEHAVGSAFGRAKSAIVIFLLGGPPQHESWDPKPDAPAEVRGEIGTIASQTPGLRVGELMPLTARLTDRLAVLRAVVSEDNAHSSSGYQMLTGVPHQPRNAENVTAKSPNLWPSIAAMVRMLRPDRDGLPSSIAVPHHIANDGEIVWPGQDAGFLGRRFDPWLIDCDPSADDFHIPDLAFPKDVSPARFDRRRSLLERIDARFNELDRRGTLAGYDRQALQAIGLLTGPTARQAFDLSKEPQKTRERYGPTRFGQSLLLARRLVEAGVSLVQVNWTRIAGGENNGTWDTHRNHCQSLREFLMPIMDQSYSALLEDLDQRGLMDETLVAWLGEFGHTPKINRNAGRDHWGQAFSVALSGGGVRGGTVFGETDAHAAYPVTGRVEPRDITATIFHCLGHSPHTEMHDPLGRPVPISRGRVIEEIL
ncbi:MAG: DUF1501 domain-containing protein [Planctomycetaceae bacterium]